jgi:hypothetical protein
MYEHRRHPLLSRKAFAWRLARHVASAALLMAISLAVGMVGYWRYEQWGWRQAFLNAAMLLGGMGPVHPPVTSEGQLFAGLYALYAGLVFLLVAGLLLAPIVHRFLHHFHWEDGSER